MKLLFLILGTVSLVLGIVGIILPILPTTPFLLLSATLYMHSSPKLYDWLLNNKYLGAYIKNYREHKIISVRVKIISMVTLWGTILSSIYVIDAEHYYIQIILLIVAIGVSWHILSHKSK